MYGSYFYVDFDNLLREYAEPVTREDKLIKHKLDSIVALYDNCGVEEKQFADEIMKVRTTFPKMDEDFFGVTTQHGAKTWNILRKYGVRSEHGGVIN